MLSLVVTVFLHAQYYGGPPMWDRRPRTGPRYDDCIMHGRCRGINPYEGGPMPRGREPYYPPRMPPPPRYWD